TPSSSASRRSTSVSPGARRPLRMASRIESTTRSDVVVERGSGGSTGVIIISVQRQGFPQYWYTGGSDDNVHLARVLCGVRYTAWAANVFGRWNRAAASSSDADG